ANLSRRKLVGLGLAAGAAGILAGIPVPAQGADKKYVEDGREIITNEYTEALMKELGMALEKSYLKAPEHWLRGGASKDSKDTYPGICLTAKAKKVWMVALVLYSNPPQDVIDV